MAKFCGCPRNNDDTGIESTKLNRDMSEIK